MTQTPQASSVVLVIEDEPVQRLMVLDMVEEAGLEAAVAMDADEAVHILETRPDIRVVFADIDLPGGVDGLKLAAAIRDRWPPIELVITSGRRNPKVDEIPTRGVFFPKPYISSEVIKALREFAA